MNEEIMYSTKVNRDKMDFLLEPGHSHLMHWKGDTERENFEPGTRIRYICENTGRTVVREIVLVNYKNLLPGFIETLDELIIER